jgi:hypothetical protein
MFGALVDFYRYGVQDVDAAGVYRFTVCRIRHQRREIMSASQSSVRSNLSWLTYRSLGLNKASLLSRTDAVMRE